MLSIYYIYIPIYITINMALDLKENLKFACGSGHSMGCGL